MMTYSFCLVFSGISEITPAMAESLFEATGHDCTPASSEGVARVWFEREAGDLGEAIGEAIREAQRAGFKVARIEVGEELASAI